MINLMVFFSFYHKFRFLIASLLPYYIASTHDSIPSSKAQQAKKHSIEMQNSTHQGPSYLVSGAQFLRFFKVLKRYDGCH
jgi:hypothetical protein